MQSIAPAEKAAWAETLEPHLCLGSAWKFAFRRAGQQENAAAPRPEPFKLATGFTQTKNLAATETARVKARSDRLERIRQQGHSCVGATAAQ